MIFIDSTEAAVTSKLPSLPCTVVTTLEDRTGADLLISTENFPISTDALIKKHLSRGALLVQRKSGMDLVNSLGDRLTSSLARMREVGARQAQCILLFTGTLTISSTGDAFLDGRNTGARYMDILAALSKWHDRGGVVEQLVADELIPVWCLMKLKHLQEYKDHPIKEVWQKCEFPDEAPLPDDPLQLPRRVKDWRRWVACMVDGIGAETVNALRAAIVEHGTLDAGITALMWATDVHGLTPTVPRWGKRNRQKMRDALFGEIGNETTVIDFTALPPIQGKEAGIFYGKDDEKTERPSTEA